MASRALKTNVPLPLAKKLDRFAMRIDRSRESIVNEALSDWIAQEELRHKLTLEGLAAIDAGDVYEHSDVRAWAKSLGTKRPLPLPTRRARR
jgi:predicted transcriptional regulator